MNIPYAFKTCTKCGKTLPATTEYFHKDKHGKYGLKSTCKKCRLEQRKQYYEDNKDKIAEYKKQYYEDNRDKIAEQHKQYYDDNRDKIREKHKQYRENNKNKIVEYQKQYHKQYYEDNKDKIAEQHKQYNKDNKENIRERQKQYYEDNINKILEQNKQYYEDNKKNIRERQKQYYEDNKDKIAEQQKQYYSTPQGQIVAFNSSNKRRLRKENQGNGITKDQWLECMKFFNWKCAYSSKVLSKDTRSLDHINPLNQGGEHEIWNLVPMYKPYNSSKRDKDMEEWYQEQDFFSEDRLQKIYEWQEYAFNKWGDTNVTRTIKGNIK